MDPEQVKKSSRVLTVSNVVVAPPKHLDPEYRWERSDGMATKTGRLDILTIVPKDGGGPWFVARWDEKEKQVDVDMYRASNSVRRFKDKSHGYCGHHSIRKDNFDRWTFKLIIKIPQERIVFEGEVSFSCTNAVHVTTQGIGAFTARAC